MKGRVVLPLTLLALQFVILKSAFASTIGPPSSPPIPQNGVAQTEDTAPLLSDGSTFVFSDTNGGLFAADFDDVYAGKGVQNIVYTFNGTDSNKQTVVSSPFSEASNVSSGFVGFLGVDGNGNSTDTPTGPTIVANLYEGSVGGTQIGTITADYSVTNPETTTFTFHIDSGITIDPPSFTAIFVLDPNLDPIILAPLEQSSLPEPSSFALLGLGGLALAFAKFRRRTAFV